MNRSMNRSKRISILASAVLGVTLLFAGVAGAEEVWVKNGVVSVRADKGPIYDEVVVAKKGAKLTVITRENGWIKVDAGNGKIGWVSEKVVSTAKVDAGLNLSEFGKTADLTEAKAGRTLREDAVEFAKGANLSDRAMRDLEIFRDNLRKAPQEWVEFMKEGKVGTYAPAN